MSIESKLRVLRIAPLLIVGLALHAHGSRAAEPSATTVIINAQLADGTGAALRQANVRIAGDRIERVGSFEPGRDEQVIDAKGLVLAPGFIDIHNHSDKGLPNDPLAETQISQGITTAVLGADGLSPWPLRAWLDERRRNPASLNIAVMAGHATLRKAVMGDDYKRVATAAEVERMAQLVGQAMDEGAAGLSSGLEYEVGGYAATDELVAMARVAAKRGGFYMTHVRDEADRSFEALQEEIAIAEQARIPVDHSHIKLATAKVLGRAQEYIGIIEAARKRGVDFLADCYPYDAWFSTIKVLVPDKRYEDPVSVQRALDDVGGASRVTIAKFPPNSAYEWHTIDELARKAGITPVEMYVRIIREGHAGGVDAWVIGHAMVEADVEAFCRRPWVMVSSDGGLGLSHPRSAGTFPRVLARYVRERKVLSLPEAIRKMTSLPAQRLGWSDRGTVREGAIADLVLFDAATVTDRATFAQPTELATGIEKVFVNGTLIWSAGKPTGARPGRVLSK